MEYNTLLMSLGSPDKLDSLSSPGPDRVQFFTFVVVKIEAACKLDCLPITWQNSYVIFLYFLFTLIF